MAIAAACHPGYNPNSRTWGSEQEMEGSGDIEYLPLMWESLPSVNGELGHCSFAAGVVESRRLERIISDAGALGDPVSNYLIIRSYLWKEMNMIKLCISILQSDQIGRAHV